MKCLQERIKELESFGMLKRIEFDEKIPKVEHHLTERGERLLKIMMDIKALAEDSDICICPIESRFKDELEMSDTFCPRRRN